MSIAEVEREIHQWSREDQDRLAAFLTLLRLQRDPAYMRKLDARITDQDSGHWMTLDQLKEGLTGQ